MSRLILQTVYTCYCLIDDFPVSQKFEMSKVVLLALERIACSRKNPANINIVPNGVQDAPIAVDLEGEVGTGDGGHPVAVIVDLWYPQLVDVVESVEVPWDKFSGVLNILFEIPQSIW